MQETYDASIGGQKGLLHVGGGDSDDDGNDNGSTVRFVSARDGSVPLLFDASRLLSCNAKGRQRMVVSYADGDGDDCEKRLATVRVLGTAADRVIGAVLELAEEAGSAAAARVPTGMRPAQADGVLAHARSTADAVAIASSSSPGIGHGDAAEPDAAQVGAVERGA